MTSSEFYTLRDTLDTARDLILAHVAKIDNDNTISSRAAARKWLLVNDDLREALDKIDNFLTRTN